MTLRQCLSGGAGGGGIASVLSSGCINGSGTLNDPIYINLDPTGYLTCGASGLRINDDFTTLYVQGCFEGSGTQGDPLVIKINPTGLLACDANGLRYAGPSGGGADNLGNHTAIQTLNMNGFNISGVSGIHLNNTPTLNNSANAILVFDSGNGSVAYRQASTFLTTSTVHWSQGQVGGLIADGNMQFQPRFIVPVGATIELIDVSVTLGVPGTTTTTLHSSILNDTGDGTPPTPGSPTSTFNLLSGEVYTPWTAMIGQVLTSEQHLQTRVETAGSGAENLAIHFWGNISF